MQHMEAGALLTCESQKKGSLYDLKETMLNKLHAIIHLSFGVIGLYLGLKVGETI